MCTWHDNYIQSNAPYRYVLTKQLSHLANLVVSPRGWRPRKKWNEVIWSDLKESKIQQGYRCSNEYEDNERRFQFFDTGTKIWSHNIEKITKMQYIAYSDSAVIILGNLWVAIFFATMLFLVSFLVSMLSFSFNVNYWLCNWINKCGMLSQILAFLTLHH